MTEKLAVLRQTYLALTIVCIAAIAFALPRKTYTHEIDQLDSILEKTNDLLRTQDPLSKFRIAGLVGKFLPVFDINRNKPPKVYVFYNSEELNQIKGSGLPISDLNQVLVHVKIPCSGDLGIGHYLGVGTTHGNIELSVFRLNAVQFRDFDGCNNFSLRVFGPEVGGLYEIYGEIGHLSPNEALTYLNQQDKKSNDAISISGISIIKSYIGILLPVFIFGLSLYFLIHLENLPSFEGKSASTVAFVPFYHSARSQFVTAFLLYYLPLISITTTLYSFSDTFLSRTIGIFSLFGQFWLASLISFNVDEKRNQLTNA